MPIKIREDWATQLDKLPVIHVVKDHKWEVIDPILLKYSDRSSAALANWISANIRPMGHRAVRARRQHLAEVQRCQTPRKP